MFNNWLPIASYDQSDNLIVFFPYVNVHGDLQYLIFSIKGNFKLIII